MAGRIVLPWDIWIEFDTTNSEWGLESTFLFILRFIYGFKDLVIEIQTPDAKVFGPQNLGSLGGNVKVPRALLFFFVVLSGFLRPPIIKPKKLAKIEIFGGPGLRFSHLIF